MDRKRKKGEPHSDSNFKEDARKVTWPPAKAASFEADSGKF
ncbi:hypothetical protein N9L68_07950 [bacterium]|nr:hypothetical protein [bacterium]